MANYILTYTYRLILTVPLLTLLEFSFFTVLNIFLPFFLILKDSVIYSGGPFNSIWNISFIFKDIKKMFQIEIE